MWRTLIAIVPGAAICLCGILAAAADDQKPEIKGGIVGKVKEVDLAGNKLTITTSQGRERTFTITEDTTMVGPNGGKVRKHLHDPRFREGFPVTIVADRDSAEEVHLGFAKDAIGAIGEHAKTASQSTNVQRQGGIVDPTNATKSTTSPPAGKDVAKHQEATKLEEEDDESEIPGHVKSFDETRHILVVTLFNGKTRSFILSQNVPVHVKGAAGVASRQGLKDPELKAGAFITVVTDDAGHKVKELKIVPASEIKKRKAG
jgi:hypothetical protein